MATSRRSFILMLGAFVLVLAGSCAVLTFPTTTRQGIDYRVTTHSIPLYVKAIDFLQRHYQYELLAGRICSGKSSDADCVSAIFEWTHENIPATPPGWPVVDNHTLTTIIRGHGKADQIADVFTTLSTYAGRSAFFTHVIDPDSGVDIVLSFACVGGEWVPFDVERHVSFRHETGRLASVQALVEDPSLVDVATKGLLHDDLRYSAFISKSTLMPFVPPRWSHADLQRPWPRVGYELRRLVGWESEPN